MKFNINDYETVQDRLQRFLKDNSDARVITENLTTKEDRAVMTWVFKTSIYLTAGDQAENLPKATGHAFEIDGGKGANITSAMENAETSSLGRALANLGYHGDKRASREEMQKVEKGVTPKGRGWVAEAKLMTNLDDLRAHWMDAKVAGASKEILDQIQEMADGKRSADELNPGSQGSLPESDAKE